MNRRRALRLVAATAAAAVVFGLAGCPRTESPAGQSAGANTLLVGCGPEPAGLDPQLVTGAAEFSILTALFEGLVELDGQTLRPIPGVAERWDVSADGLTYTFFLRADAKWSDGRPLGAADFVASYRRLLAPKLGAGYAYLLDPVVGAAEFRGGKLADFAQVGVAAVDARTLRFTLRRPTAWFLAALALPPLAPVPVDAIRKFGAVDARETNWARAAHWVGNGAFTLAEWRRGQSLALRRNVDYWDAAAVKLAGIRFVPTDAVETEERMFRAGQLHVTSAVPIGRVEAYRKERPEVLRSDAYLGTDFYRVNTARPEFADPRVRRALALAVDRRAIAARVLRGTRAPAGTFVPPGVDGTGGVEPVPVDFAAARALLAEAGHAGGAGLPPIEILFNTSEQHRAVAEAVQEMWKRELGLDVRLQNQENQVVLQARRDGQYQIVRSSWLGDYLDATTFLDVFAAGSANNHTRWNDAEYDALLAQAHATNDAAARAALLRRAEERLLAAAPIIPIYHNANSYLILPTVRGWHANLLNRRPWKQVSFGP